VIRTLGFAMLLALPSLASAQGLEEHDFILNCVGCHRMDGEGSRTVPSLHAMREVAAAAGARAYFARVPGVAQAPVSDARLADLLNWVYARFVGKAPRPPYSAAEVRALRRQPWLDPAAERARLHSTVGSAQRAPDLNAR